MSNRSRLLIDVAVLAVFVAATLVAPTFSRVGSWFPTTMAAAGSLVCLVNLVVDLVRHVKGIELGTVSRARFELVGEDPVEDQMGAEGSATDEIGPARGGVAQALHASVAGQEALRWFLWIALLLLAIASLPFFAAVAVWLIVFLRVESGQAWWRSALQVLVLVVLISGLERTMGLDVPSPIFWPFS